MMQYDMSGVLITHYVREADRILGEAAEKASSKGEAAGFFRNSMAETVATDLLSYARRVQRSKRARLAFNYVRIGVRFVVSDPGRYFDGYFEDRWPELRERSRGRPRGGLPAKGRFRVDDGYGDDQYQQLVEDASQYVIDNVFTNERLTEPIMTGADVREIAEQVYDDFVYMYYYPALTAVDPFLGAFFDVAYQEFRQVAYTPAVDIVDYYLTNDGKVPGRDTGSRSRKSSGSSKAKSEKGAKGRC